MDTQTITIDASANYRSPSRGHVLVVDDDAGIRERLADYLTLNDFRVTPAENGRQMMEILNQEAVDLIALEPSLRGEDGHQIASLLRETSMVPIIIITSRAEEADRVMGLELGADDYVTKPFSTRELLARIRAVMRRYRIPESSAEANRTVREYHFAGWTLNLPLHALTSPTGGRVPISNGEFGLLVALLGHPQRILTRDQLLELSRLRTTEVYDRAIDVQILRLRRKIESDPARPELIKTERGIGYRFCVSVESVHSSSKPGTGRHKPAQLGEGIHVRNGSSYARNNGDPLPGIMCR
jgi:two-component system, OmpR family, response regulator